MALSGSVKTSTYDGRGLQLSWTATQSVANNTSTVSWTLKAFGGNVSWYSTGPITLKINGTTVYSTTDRIDMYTSWSKSGTITIAHNNDGTKSFAVSIQTAVYYSSVNCTASTTFTLNQIARHHRHPRPAALPQGTVTS